MLSIYANAAAPSTMLPIIHVWHMVIANPPIAWTFLAILIISGVGLFLSAYASRHANPATSA